jgi:hypothetical protein
VKRSTRRRSPGDREPLPPGGVYLVCTDEGDWVGDVIDAGEGRTWWKGDRYAVWIDDGACTVTPPHRHAYPPDHKVAAKAAEARRKRTSIPLRVSPVR